MPIAQPRTERISKDALTPVVRRALGSPRFEIADWKTALLKSRKGSADVNGMVCRITGNGRNPGQDERGWSVILKVGRARNREEESRRENYREAVFYETGFAEGLTGGFRVPVCYAVDHSPRDMPWIWLEDIKAENEWPLRLRKLAAYHLGQFQGSFLAGRPLPTDPIFDRAEDLYRDNANCVKTHLPEMLKVFRENPVTRPTFGGHLGERLLRLGRECASLLEPVRGLPLTFCHRDFGPGNVLNRRLPDGSEETVALDWDFCGTGQLGLELQSFISGSTIYPGKQESEVKNFVEIALESYLRGLKDAGWKGESGAVRYACTAILAVQGGFHLAIYVKMLVGWGEESREKIENCAAVQNFLLDLAEEAKKYEKYVR